MPDHEMLGIFWSCLQHAMVTKKKKSEREATVKEVINFMASGYVCTLLNNNRKSNTWSWHKWLCFDFVHVCVCKACKIIIVYERMQIFSSKAAHISDDESWPWAYSAYCWYCTIDLKPPLRAWMRLHSELNPWIYMFIFHCFPLHMPTVKVMHCVWFQNGLNESWDQTELQRQITLVISEVPQNDMKWLQVIIMGAKEEIRGRCYTAAKPEHGGGWGGWVTQQKNWISTRYTTVHFLFHTVSRRESKGSLLLGTQQVLPLNIVVYFCHLKRSA